MIVYSVRDSSVGKSQLITIFPAVQSTVDAVLDPATMGARTDLTTRYNAYVAGVTGAAFSGTRSVETVQPY